MTQLRETNPLAPPAPSLPAAETPDSVVNSADLFAGRQRLRILHAGEFYQLQITQKGKLILTK